MTVLFNLMLTELDHTNSRTASADEKAKQEALLWLSPLDYSAKQRDFDEKAAPNTGQWLLNSKDFVSWRSQEIHKLWCIGMREYITRLIGENLLTKKKLVQERRFSRKLMQSLKMKGLIITNDQFNYCQSSQRAEIQAWQK